MAAPVRAPAATGDRSGTALRGFTSSILVLIDRAVDDLEPVAAAALRDIVAVKVTREIANRDAAEWERAA